MILFQGFKLDCTSMQVGISPDEPVILTSMVTEEEREAEQRAQLEGLEKFVKQILGAE